ncbi:MAG: M23/M56 family metallopeptidase, partial [Bacteroidota bacterium]
MNSLLLYIFQVSLVFSSFYLLYKVFFSRFTFHGYNRAFLLLLLPLSLLIPLSNSLFPAIQFPIEIPLFEDFTVFAERTNSTVSSTETESHQTLQYSFWIFCVYVIGVLCFAWRLFRATFRLYQLKQQSQKTHLHNTTVYNANISEVFSYFHWIFVPTSKITTIDVCILTHEKAHGIKKHSWDMLFAELFIAMNWFNPLAYLYRKSLKAIHEFQADVFVLKAKTVKKSSYLQVLLTSLEPTQLQPTYNYFSQPSLKKRIEMITKSPSKKAARLVYLVLVPLIALACIAFKSPTTTTILEEITPITVDKAENGVPTVFPVQNKTKAHISSPFGVFRKHPKLKHKTKHGGIDIKAAKGTPIIATADGTVLKAQDEGNWGNLIIISHANGFETWYAHLQAFNSKTGQTVKKGEIIGYVGSTGLSTAPHLHYEVRQHGKRLNPLEYITE